MLYLPVVRSSELSRLHAEVWDEVEKASEGSLDYYRPEQWVPHITIADGECLKGLLPEIIRWLNEQEFYWDIAVNNFTFIDGNEGTQQVKLRFNLGV